MQTDRDSRLLQARIDPFMFLDICCWGFSFTTAQSQLARTNMKVVNMESAVVVVHARLIALGMSNSGISKTDLSPSSSYILPSLQHKTAFTPFLFKYIYPKKQLNPCIMVLSSISSKYIPVGWQYCLLIHQKYHDWAFWGMIRGFSRVGLKEPAWNVDSVRCLWHMRWSWACIDLALQTEELTWKCLWNNSILT